MKLIYIFVLFISVSQFSFSQLSDEEEAEIIWETNIQAILDLDKKKVLSQTVFPLNTYKGVWNRSTFISDFDFIFNTDLLKDLKYQDVRDLQPSEEESGELAFILIVMTFTEIDGEDFESSTIFSFKKFEGDWKMYNIELMD